MNSFKKYLIEKRFVFATGATPATPGSTPGAVPPPPQGPETPKEQEREPTLEDYIEKAPLDSEVKQRARQALISEDNAMYKEELVRDLLDKKIPQPEFLKALDKLEEQEKSWVSITKEQRAIRKNIRELHEKTKSYREVVTPLGEKSRESERNLFYDYLTEVRGLNKADHAMDSTMKQMLKTATEQKIDGQEVMTKHTAKEIYLLHPGRGDFESKFASLTSGIKNMKGGKKFVERLKALKMEELRIEQEFEKLYTKIHVVIERNLSRAKREADKKRYREIASRVVGIHLEKGTVLKVEDPGFLLPPKTKNMTITDVTFEEVPFRDHSGKILGHSLGVPKVRIDGGNVMTLARFKKWVDAQNAVEETKSVRELSEKMGLKELGLDLQEGQTLEYLKITGRDEKTHDFKREVQRTTIKKMKDGKVHFYTPVQYQTGIPPKVDAGLPVEERESLTYGEFLKWYLQNSVFLSLSMEELQKNLRTYSRNFNRQFGVSAHDNPPIDVTKGEVLIYPDGSGRKFTITSIDKERIEFDNASPMTFPQFFLWVRNNNVRKLAKPEEAKGSKEPIEQDHKKTETPEEAALRKKRENDEARKVLSEQESGSPLELIKNFWHQTTLLSMNDMWTMLVSVKDFIKRRHERRSKGRYSDVASRLPGLLGTEFEKIKQAAENEEVNQFKEPMEHWSIEKIKHTLNATTNKDVAKACIMTLTHKGEMRWDDPEFWKVLNFLTSRHLGRTDLFIPTDPRVHVANKTSGEDMTKAACDALWGDGTWHEWFSQNINTFNSAKSAFLYKAKQLEADPKGTGGLAGELKRLLKEWKEGKYVSPHEYEEYIDYAIDAGKMTAEQKMFFLIAGIVTRNPETGESLLHMDRPGELDGKYLNKFPMLDFFTDKRYLKPDPPPDGPGRKGRPWVLKDYEYWVRAEFPDDFKNNWPSMQFTRFLWTKMMTNDNVRTRLSKGLRNAENMDHDDTQMFIPPATAEEITSVILGSPSGGEKKNFTPEGYANGYPGFNQYLLTLSYGIDATHEEDEKVKLVQAMKESLKAYVYYDTTLMNRYKKAEGPRYARLSAHHYDRQPVVDSTTPRKHQTQLTNIVRIVAKEYGMSDDKLKVVFDDNTGSMNVASEQERQKKIEAQIDDFVKFIDGITLDDGGAKMLAVMRGARDRDPDAPDALRGMGISDPKAFRDLMSGKKRPTTLPEDFFEVHGHGGHGGGHAHKKHGNGKHDGGQQAEESYL